jgi:putative endonuclease
VAKALTGRAAVGAEGEALACRFLEGLGYRVVARNFRCRAGEIDVVAVSPEGITVFVEVKARQGTSHGEGFEAVTYGKRLRLIRAARFFAAQRGQVEGPIRFDVISILWSDGQPRVRHDPSAFDGEGG